MQKTPFLALYNMCTTPNRLRIRIPVACWKQKNVKHVTQERLCESVMRLISVSYIYIHIHKDVYQLRIYGALGHGPLWQKQICHRKK